MNTIPPLTPSDCDLRDFAFMPLDVVRLRDSDMAAIESGDVFRASVLLWCASWHQVPAASLPEDDRVLSNLSGYGRVVKEWLKVKDEVLSGFVKCSDGRLYHPVVAEKANESYASKLRHSYGKMAERLRKLNKQLVENNQQAISQPTFDQWNSAGRSDPVTPEIYKSSAGIPPEKLNLPPESEYVSAGKNEPSAGIPPEKALKGEVRDRDITTTTKDLSAPSAQTSKKGTRLPEDWVLPKPWGEWAMGEQPSWTVDDVRRVASDFKDHWASNANKASSCKADWLATWRKWVRSPLNQIAKSQNVQDARLDVARQIMGNQNGNDRKIIDITGFGSIESDGARIPETFDGVWQSADGEVAGNQPARCLSGLG